MSRIRTPFVSGTILNNPLAIGGTSLSSAALASLPAIASPDIAVIVLDPAGAGGVPEVVWVTAHTASATTATITRGAEGTTARAHNLNTPWIHAPTTYDFQEAFGPDIAVASSISLPVSSHENMFNLTGTGSISTIALRPAGSRLYLRAGGTGIQINHGSILFANVSARMMSFPLEANEIVEFVSTGTNWVLVGTSSRLPFGYRVVANNQTEQTTASTTAIDLVTLSGLNIPVFDYVRVTLNARKTAGAAALAHIGLKINSTIVCEAAAGATRLITFSAANEAQWGCCQFIIPPRSANYLKNSTGTYNVFNAATNVAEGACQPTQTAAMPNANITSLAIRAVTASASQTIGVKEVLVESFSL